jgi:periplasmic protein TonB
MELLKRPTGFSGNASPRAGRTAALVVITGVHLLVGWQLLTARVQAPEIVRPPLLEVQLVPLAAPKSVAAPVTPLKPIEPTFVTPLPVPLPVPDIPMPSPIVAAPARPMEMPAPVPTPVAPAPPAAPAEPVAVAAPAPERRVAAPVAVVEEPPKPIAAPAPQRSQPVQIPSAAIAYVRQPAVVYPPLSRRLRESGVVIVEAEIGTDGRPARVTVHQSSGHPRLDEAALEAVRSALFRPYVADGRPAAAMARVPIAFELDR